MRVVCFLLFLLFFVIAFVTLPLWLDYLIVYVMRTCRIYLFPTAIRLALSLETQADEWMLDDDKLSHPHIGRVWLITSGRTLVRLPDTNQSRAQDWRPNWIEHRIIRNAANALIWQRRAEQLDRVLPRL